MRPWLAIRVISMRFIWCIVTILIIFCGNVISRQTWNQETLDIVKISARDQRAVMQAPGDELRVLKPGDTVKGWGRIAEISEERVVFKNVVQGREAAETVTETVIVRIHGQQQSVERVRSVADPVVTLSEPVFGLSRQSRAMDLETGDLETGDLETGDLETGDHETGDQKTGLGQQR